MADNVWEQDYAVLDAAVVLVLAGVAIPVELGAVSDGLGPEIGDDDLGQSLARLYAADPPYLMEDPDAPAEQPVGGPIAVTERGLRITGAWPAKRETGEPPVRGLLL